MSHKIWLSSPHMGGDEINYINDAFASNWIAPLGPNVNEFEKDLCRYTGSKYAAALSSGTAAIHLALILLGVKSGDEVICSSFTFSASANPIIYQGAIPIFIDSENTSWNMDPESLETAINDRISRGNKPKAIIAVHLYGNPARVDEIAAIAEKYDIHLIEDAAEALGAELNERKMGTFGLMGILSFNGNKIITTSGGGALLSDKAEFIERARFLATQARDNAPHYQHSQIGYNYRMSNICAGIGRGQMKVLYLRVEQRRKKFFRYKMMLSQLPGIQYQQELPGAFSNRWLTAIAVDPEFNGGVTRETIRLALEAENIESRPLWKPMHLQPIFERYPYYGKGVSDKLFENGLCLPSGSNMTEEEQNRIIDVINKCYEKVGI